MNLNNAILFILVALSTIAPPLNTPAGVYADPQIVVPVVLMLFFGVRFIETLMINPFRHVMFLFVVAILFGVFSSFIEGEGNFYGTLRLVKALIMFLGTLALLAIIRGKHGIDFIRAKIPVWIYLLIGFNGLVMVAEFYSPSFYEFVRTTTLAGGFTTILWDPSGDYRMPGLSLSGGAQISLFQSMGILLFPVLVLTERRISRIVIYSGLLLVNIFSVSISGRSGFYNLAVLAPVVVFLLICDSNHFQFRAVWKQTVALVSVCGVALLFVAYAVLFPEEIAQKYSVSLATAISRNTDFIGGGDSGFLQNATIETLRRDHFILPSDASTWVLGAPIVMEDRGLTRSLDSDIGYIVMLNAFGIFGCTLQILVNLIPFYLAVRYRRHAFRLGYATIIVTASVLFFNSKEVMFFTRMAWPVQMVLWCAFVYSLEGFRKDWFKSSLDTAKEVQPRSTLRRQTN